jgi:hypothetical protein
MLSCFSSFSDFAALPSLFSVSHVSNRYGYLTKPGLSCTTVHADGLIAAAYAGIFTCLFWVVLARVPNGV